MKELNRGALPYQKIQELIEAGVITSVQKENIRPASYDLSLSEEIYSVEGIFLPKPGESVRSVLDKVKKKKHIITKPLVCGKIYIARIAETLSLPKSIYGYCNPKSTSGRLDMHIRLLADGVSRYDAVTSGFEGELWVSITPKSFSIELFPGVSLNQLRLFVGDARLTELDLELEMKKSKLLWGQYTHKAISYKDVLIRDNDGSLVLSLDLSNDILGYVGKLCDKSIALKNNEQYARSRYWKPVRLSNGSVHLKQNQFYILSTFESVRVPPHLACEMIPMDERSGEFRSHYAGFIDPGWGWGKRGEGKGRPLTLEVRPFEDIIIRQGQPIGKIRFEKMTTNPDMQYDQMDSNYTVQTGPRLAKQFKT